MEWQDVHAERHEELSQNHIFSFKKRQGERDIPFVITVREFSTPPAGQRLRFFAEADKQVNQNTAAFLPAGWGDCVAHALVDCIRLIRQFPYEGSE